MSEISEAQAARDLTAKNGFKKFYSRNAFLLSLIEDRAKHLKKASDVYKRRQLVFELVSVSATGLITILAGINLDGWVTYSKYAVLILGAFTTVITAVRAFHAPQEIRVLCTRTLGKLLALRNEINFSEIGKPATEPNDTESRTHFDEFQKIMEEHNCDWRKLRSSRSSQS